MGEARARASGRRGGDAETTDANDDEKDEKDATKGEREQRNGISREDILSSCTSTSMAMVIGAIGVRAGASAASAEASRWDLERAAPLASDDFTTMALTAIVVASAVTVGRIVLLEVWDEFAASTDRSNAQVLGALEGAMDVAFVATLPAIGEELLFRGTLLPLIGGLPGVFVSSVVFGALHVGGGRTAAFGVWASAVGACYGACALHTGSVAAPMAAHALANIASAVYWNATRADKLATTTTNLGTSEPKVK